jgi:transposase
VYANNKSIRKTVGILKVGKSTVQRWLVMAAIVTPSTPPIERKKPKLTQILEIVDSSIQTDPFTTCRKLQAIIDDKLGLKVSKELVRIAIIRLDYSRKKARFYGIAKNALLLNQRFIALRNHYIEKGHPIFSIDETGFGRFSYHKAFGYAKRGKPLFIRKEKPRMTSISVLACASNEGWTSYKAIKGGVNRLTFCEFIKSLVLPEGAVMLLDNASIHKGNVVKENVVLFLQGPSMGRPHRTVRLEGLERSAEHSADAPSRAKHFEARTSHVQAPTTHRQADPPQTMIQKSSGRGPTERRGPPTKAPLS